MRRTTRLSIQALLSTALLAGFPASGKPTEVASTWHGERASIERYAKILIVGVAESSGPRRRFENAMASALEAAGITAWPSHTRMPTDAPPERDSVAKAVESTGADAILVTRLIDHEVTGEEVEIRSGEREKPEQPKAVDFFQYNYHVNVMDDQYFPQRDYGGDADFKKEGHLVVKSTVKLSTDFYETEKGTLIYSVDTTTFEKESEFEIIDQATKAIAKRLRKDRLVR